MKQWSKVVWIYRLLNGFVWKKLYFHWSINWFRFANISFFLFSKTMRDGCFILQKALGLIHKTKDLRYGTRLVVDFGFWLCYVRTSSFQIFVLTYFCKLRWMGGWYFKVVLLLAPLFVRGKLHSPVWNPGLPRFNPKVFNYSIIKLLFDFCLEPPALVS